jgi:hypothetical protein
MGKQVRFRVDRADIEKIEEYLRAHGAKFIPWRSDAPEVIPQDSLFPVEGAVGPLIVRDEDLPRVRRSYVDTQGYWLVDRESAPMIDWAPGKLDTNPMSYGRLHFSTNRGGQSPSISLVDFIRWADSVLAWVRREFSYSKDEQLYYGPAAATRMGFTEKQQNAGPRG